MGHDGLLVVGGERVVAGDANSGGSVREVVPGNIRFFLVIMVDYLHDSYRFGQKNEVSSL